MVRSEEVNYRRKFNADPPHNGGFGSLIKKENFERRPHLPRSRSWGWDKASDPFRRCQSKLI